MPRTIHVTVTYSYHVEDDRMSDKQAITEAENIDLNKANIFDTKSVVHDRWKEEKPKPRKGIGSY